MAHRPLSGVALYNTAGYNTATLNGLIGARIAFIRGRLRGGVTGLESAVGVTTFNPAADAEGFTSGPHEVRGALMLSGASSESISAIVEGEPTKASIS